MGTQNADKNSFVGWSKSNACWNGKSIVDSGGREIPSPKRLAILNPTPTRCKLLGQDQ